MTKSASNRLCKTWSDLQYNDRFYYELPSNNYCGNHVLDQSKPWCIVEDGLNLVYEHCNIPGCPKSSNMATMTLSPQSVDSRFLSNVYQCFYHTGSDAVYFHSSYRSVFDSACSKTNATKILYVCSFYLEEWKIIEYLCDSVSVLSSSIESTSAYEDTSSTMESVTGILSELSSSTIIESTPTYDATISLDSVSDVISNNNDVVFSTGSFSYMNTDYLFGSESCWTCSTTTSTIAVSSYVTEALISTQLVSRSCTCYCRPKPSPNTTDLGTKSNHLPTMENLILNKSNLSRTFRKKNSVHDSRTFSIAVGSVGVFIIIGSALFLASSDFSRVLMGTSDIMNRVRATTNTNDS
ncbi:hypothetical protein LOTGIDRAFT_152605 [Lottia gigantea]|uniref:Kringle domain-containing protein n=1 Tax=Lottia gigantea TaxID=225164 RepID=V4C755_LOTGI|nr:hypothetical protein LOTGIDRAFT_152605 [Lottia gigantea]ESO97514.1 hypothetical protein LOTGIDRAFT_152605 [Lottia gigantea]